MCVMVGGRMTDWLNIAEGTQFVWALAGACLT